MAGILRNTDQNPEDKKRDSTAIAQKQGICIQINNA